MNDIKSPGRLSRKATVTVGSAGMGMAAVLALGAMSLPATPTQSASSEAPGGTISGLVALDAGKPIGLRIKARNEQAKVTYNVFSRQGEYRVPEMMPGTYQVWISQNGFVSQPQTVVVEAGATARLDLRASVKPGFDIEQQFLQRDPHTAKIDQTLELVSFDELYPDQPGRAELIDDCFACHATMFHQMRADRDGWEYMVRRMTDRVSMEGERQANIIYTKEHFPAQSRELITEYLIRNFGIDAPMRDLKLDEFVPNEDVISEAVYVEYDVPLTDADMRPRSYHDPFIAPNGEIWVNDRANRSLVRIDPDATDASERIIEEYQAPWPDTSMHGITIDTEGRVYYADINGGYLGELDRETGEFKRYETTGEMEAPWNVPAGTRTSESMVQIVTDKDDNVWGNLVSGEKIFRLDAETREIETWLLPTPNSNPYGMIAKPDGTVWTAGISSDMIIKFDPGTETFTEYATPTQPSAPRRLDDDAAGNIWWAEYVGGNLGKLDTETGEMEQFPFPLKYSTGYDAWAVGEYIWVTEATYQTLIRFDPKTEAFVYYPLPMSQPSGNPGVPKLENEKDGTIWFAYRGLRDQPNPVVKFSPKANAGPWSVEQTDTTALGAVARFFRNMWFAITA